MPRERAYWYRFIITLLRLYPDGLGNSTQAITARAAIDKTIQDTALLQSGDTRMRLITMMYFSANRKSRRRAALDLYISESTAKRWDSAFIYSVAKYMGFTEK